MSPLPIAIVIGQLTQGGSERQLAMFLARCDRARWSPTLYVSGELGPWEGPIRALGIPIRLLTGGPWAKLHGFYEACRAQRPTCFFSWSSYTNVYGLTLLGTPTRRIGSFRNALFSDLPTTFRAAWARASVAGISVAVCNSRDTLEGLRTVGPRLAAVYVPNGVELPGPTAIEVNRRHWRAALGINQDEILVVGVGRLAPQKNFSLFLDVIARVTRDAPVRAVIVGDDMGELASLRERVERHRLGEVVRFLGRVADAREVICAADVFLLTSDHEGMPNVILEAMAAGIPCVATRVNAVADIIQPAETGFLAPSGDAGALAAHVARLATDPALRKRIGSAARDAMMSGHDPDVVARHLWELCGDAQAVPGEVGEAHEDELSPARVVTHAEVR